MRPLYESALEALAGRGANPVFARDNIKRTIGLARQAISVTRETPDGAAKRCNVYLR